MQGYFVGKEMGRLKVIACGRQNLLFDVFPGSLGCPDVGHTRYVWQAELERLSRDDKHRDFNPDQCRVEVTLDTRRSGPQAEHRSDNSVPTADVW